MTTAFLAGSSTPCTGQAPTGEKVQPAPKAPMPAAGNPLADWIKKLFGSGSASGSGAASTDRIDARAPHDAKQAKLLDHASQLARERNWNQTLQVLQFLLARPDDSLYRLPNGRLVSIRAQANRLLATFPADVLDKYRLQYGAEAKRLLTEARQNGELSKYVEVAERFFHTDAGYAAMNHLGTLHFDRGDFGMAAHCFQQLMHVNAAITKDPKWRFKAAFAFRKANQPWVSKKLLAGLSSADPKGLQLGGAPVVPDKWLAGAETLAMSRPAVLQDWPLLYGTASRNGTSVGGEPLLLSRWSHPSTLSDSIQQRIDNLILDLTDQGRAAIPAFFPLMIDGKVAFRTLRGVQVVDAETGRPLWQTDEGISAERILNQDLPRQFGAQMTWNLGGLNRGFRSSSGTAAEQQPLTGLLFRNGNYGIISSDGRQLFVIEDHALLSRYQPGYSSRVDPSRSDKYRRDWTTNKLTSYDLNTGRPLWSVGGRAMNESFDLPLAGSFFFGAPVPDGDDLFVVVEQNNAIRLFSLHPTTGLPKWSQLVAFTDTKIDRDFGRRWWTSQMAIGDGVVVCPTTVGWLVAVDRINRTILWAYRYSKPQPETRKVASFRNDPSYVQSTPLNGRWCPSAPVIVGSRVVYTPSEQPLGVSGGPDEPTVVCLNLFDGRVVWKHPKGSFLYLAGVIDGRVVLVGSDRVAALSLESGKQLWTTPLPASAGRPSGRGVVVGDRYHLPLRSGQLWTFNLTDGSVQSRSALPAGTRALGNLAMYRGLLLSLNPLGLTSFEQHEAITEKIRERKTRNPHDPWPLLREAEILLLKQKHAEALAVLRKIRPDAVKTELKSRYRSSLIASLAAIIRSNFRGHDGEMQQLAEFVQSANEKRYLRQLAAERHQARSEFRSAFDLYWELANSGDGERHDDMVARGGDSRVMIRMDVWLSGKLADCWSQVADADRVQLDKQITAAADKALAGQLAEQYRFEILFGFHPTCLDVQQAIAESLAQSGDFARASSRLLVLSRHSDPKLAASSLERLARLSVAAGLKRDADALYEQLARDYANVQLAEGKTAAQLVQDLRREHKIGPNSARRPPSWGPNDLKLVRARTNYSSYYTQELNFGRPRLPFFQDHRFQYRQQNQRVDIFNGLDGAFFWTLPLKSKAGWTGMTLASARTAGFLLLIRHRGVLHCLSPVEKKLVWSKTLTSRPLSTYAVHGSHGASPMRTGDAIAATSRLRQQSSSTRRLGVVNSQVVCYRARHGITVLDTLTGEVLWTRRGNARVFGTEDVIYVTNNQDGKTVALRARDGKRLKRSVRLEVAKTIHVSGQDLVMAESKTAAASFNPLRLLGGRPRAKNTVIHRFGPVERKSKWKYEYPANTFCSLIDRETLAVLKPTGEFELLDLETGKVQKFTSIPKTETKSTVERYAVSDVDNVYLILNKSRPSISSQQIPTLRVNGVVYVFDRKTGRQRWKQPISQQQLVLQFLKDSPILLFVARSYQRQGRFSYSSLRLSAFDKQTGRRLADVQTASSSSWQLRGLNLNMADRYVELHSYNERLRLFAVDAQAAAK